MEFGRFFSFFSCCPFQNPFVLGGGWGLHVFHKSVPIQQYYFGIGMTARAFAHPVNAAVYLRGDPRSYGHVSPPIFSFEVWKKVWKCGKFTTGQFATFAYFHFGQFATFTLDDSWHSFGTIRDKKSRESSKTKSRELT